jgi:hypothetical protein
MTRSFEIVATTRTFSIDLTRMNVTAIDAALREDIVHWTAEEAKIPPAKDQHAYSGEWNAIQANTNSVGRCLRIVREEREYCGTPAVKALSDAGTDDVAGPGWQLPWRAPSRWRRPGSGGPAQAVTARNDRQATQHAATTGGREGRAHRRARDRLCRQSQRSELRDRSDRRTHRKCAMQSRRSLGIGCGILAADGRSSSSGTSRYPRRQSLTLAAAGRAATGRHEGRSSIRTSTEAFIRSKAGSLQKCFVPLRDRSE